MLANPVDYSVRGCHGKGEKGKHLPIAQEEAYMSGRLLGLHRMGGGSSLPTCAVNCRNFEILKEDLGNSQRKRIWVTLREFLVPFGHQTAIPRILWEFSFGYHGHKVTLCTNTGINLNPSSNPECVYNSGGKSPFFFFPPLFLLVLGLICQTGEPGLKKAFSGMALNNRKIFAC